MMNRWIAWIAAFLGLVTRAARIGSYLTEDVTLDLGDGSAPVQGRDTVMGMAARLQSGGSAFTVAFEDVTIAVTGSAADVTLTATVTHPGTDRSEPSIDARELDVGMRKVDGEWLIARVTAVEPLTKQ